MVRWGQLHTFTCGGDVHYRDDNDEGVGKEGCYAASIKEGYDHDKGEEEEDGNNIDYGDKGGVAVPKRMNFRKSSRGVGHFHP